MMPPYRHGMYIEMHCEPNGVWTGLVCQRSGAIVYTTSGTDYGTVVRDAEGGLSAIVRGVLRLMAKNN